MEERLYKDSLTITYPHRHCNVKPPDDECNILEIGLHLVQEVLCTAEEFISADMPEVFYYKHPRKLYAIESDFFGIGGHRPDNSSCLSIDKKLNVHTKEYFDYNDNSSMTDQSASTGTRKEDARYPNDIEWSTIEGFNLRDCAGQIRDYIELWKLAPNTKCALLVRDEAKLLANKGFRYFVDALFSNPTPKCPNPLAVAKVHFYIQIPELMPKYYPVMVTYRFEGYKSMFYTHGNRQVRSLDFQRFFIDTILHTKLNFYAELFRCRYPNEKELTDIMEDEDDDASQYVCEEYLNENEEEEELSVEKFDFLDKI